MALNGVSKCSKKLAKPAQDDNDLPEGGGVSNHWNGIRTGLDWNGTIRNSEITG